MNRKISIITITLNSDHYLEQTITSVVNQTYSNIEYIIIDGGSTDSTLDIIKNYELNIDRWISEPDEGIADAMNKGLALATGDYILFLHSDDYLLNKMVLKQAAIYLTDACDIVAFSIMLEENGKRCLVKPRGITWWINFKTGIYHQSVFCSQKLFREIGMFDTNFRIVMDYDFFLRAFRTHAYAKNIDIPLTLMRLVGISSQHDWPNLKKRFLEERNVHKKNCSKQWMKILYAIYWSFYLPYRKISHSFNKYRPMDL